MPDNYCPSINAGEYAYVTSSFTDKDGKTVIIPAGWTVSGFDNEQTVKDGLIIYKGLFDMDWKRATPWVYEGFSRVNSQCVYNAKLDCFISRFPLSRFGEGEKTSLRSVAIANSLIVKKGQVTDDDEWIFMSAEELKASGHFEWLKGQKFYREVLGGYFQTVYGASLDSCIFGKLKLA